MTVKQDLEIEHSKLRQWLNEYSTDIQSGKCDEWTDEEKTQKREDFQTKSNRMTELEPALQAAIMAEADATETIERGEFDEEAKELRALAEDAQLSEFVSASLLGRGDVEGKERELLQALNIKPTGQGITIPLFMLIPPGEVEEDGKQVLQRADTVTSLAAVKNQVHMGSYLQRVFRKKACLHLGVTMESAMIGESNHTVITGGTQAGTVERNSGLDANQVTMSVINLDPHRITARVIWETIDVARLPMLESQIRHDIGMVFATAMEKEIWDGDDNDELTTQGLKGGITTAAHIDSNNTPATRTAVQTRGDIAACIDGLYATSPRDVKMVAATLIYNTWLNLADAAIDELTLNTLMQQGYDIISSLYVDTGSLASGNTYAIASRANGLPNAFTVAVWPTMAMVIDHYTKAKQGQVILTLNGMWDCAMIREANFRRYVVG